MTFDLFTAKANQFTSVHNCTKTLNMVKFSKALLKISCSPDGQTDALTHEG